MKITVTLSLPDRRLSPNYTVGSFRGRMGKANAIKKYRQAAHAAGIIASHGERLKWKEATVEATFYFKQDRRRDGDNLQGSLKAAFDGLADAGVVSNDSGFRHQPVKQAKDKANPRVEITITRKDGAE